METHLPAISDNQSQSIKKTNDVLQSAGYPPNEIVNALAQAHKVSSDQVIYVLSDSGKQETAVASDPVPLQAKRLDMSNSTPPTSGGPGGVSNVSKIMEEPTPIRMSFISYLSLLLHLAAMMMLPHSDVTTSYGLIWAVELLLLISILLQISRHVTGRWLGFLINERNLMSLSRLQLVVWTLLVLSAYFTAVMYRIAHGVANPLDIGIDEQLWLLMGISSASLIGSPLILSTKQTKTVADDKIDDELINNNSIGTLYVNSRFGEAHFTDMFEGEEVKNAFYLDMAKVQMFFFTLIAALSYAVLLIHTFNTIDGSGLTSLPVPSNGFIALLGISHAGYLTSKAIDKTKTS